MSKPTATTLVAPVFWHFDEETRANIDPVDLAAKKFVLVTLSNRETEKVKSIFAHSPRPNFKVLWAQGIVAPHLEDRFRAYQFTLNLNKSNHSGLQELEDLFLRMSAPFKDPTHENIEFLPTWHGTTDSAFERICLVGYEPTASNSRDGGYFGTGVYSTPESDYALREYEMGALILNWTGTLVRYYITEGENIRGMTTQGCDGHYVAVKKNEFKQTREDPEYRSCKLGSHSYTEVVIRDTSACLPRYRVSVEQIFVKSPHFTGRKKLLTQIAKDFNSGERVIVLHGPPGIGKSELVQAYVEENADNYFFIWRIDSETPKKMEKSYEDLEGYLKTPAEILSDKEDKRDVIKRVHDRLKTWKLIHKKPVLVVFDHVESPIDLPDNVQILITTRDKKLFKSGVLLEVPRFSEEEGAEFFIKCLPSSSAQLNFLAQEFQLFPSLLKRVAVYIKKGGILKNPTKEEIDYFSAQIMHPIEQEIYFRRLSMKEGIEPLRHLYLDGIDSKQIKLLASIPNPSGQRPSFLRGLIEGVFSDVPQPGRFGFTVMVKCPCFNGKRLFLKKGVIDNILDKEGNILQKYPTSAHLKTIQSPFFSPVMHFPSLKKLILEDCRNFTLFELRIPSIGYIKVTQCPNLSEIKDFL